MGAPVPQEDLPNQYSLNPINMAIDRERQYQDISIPQEKFIRAMFGQESTNGTNTKTSNRNAVGISQIQPGTFEGVAEEGWDIHNKVDNAQAGIRYALEGLDKAGGDYKKGAVYYYGGPSALKAFNEGIYYSDTINPTAPDTNEYSDQVVSRMGKIKIVHRSKLVPLNDIPKEFRLTPHEGATHQKGSEGFPDISMMVAQGDALDSVNRNAYFKATGERISGGGEKVPETQVEKIIPETRPPGYISTPPSSNLSGLIQTKMKGGMSESEAKKWAADNGIK